MKNIKIIIGVILAILATKSFVDISEGHSGAGLGGMITFYVIMLIISGLLIYSGVKKPKKQNRLNKENDNINDKINSLKELRDKEILTEEEYNEKIKNLENLKSDEEVKLSEDYKKLKSLFNDGILNKQEFESKVEILKEKLGEEEVSPEEKEEFFEGLCTFTNEDFDYGFKNEQGHIIIDPIYEYAGNFSNGLALVRYNGKFGFINKIGVTVIDMIYDNAEDFSNNKAFVVLKKREFYIDKIGNEI